MWANLNNLFVYLASVTMNLALLYGMGGIVQAIENLKTVWQTVMVVVLLSQMPTLQEIVGCAVGLAGVTVIVMNK